MDQGPEMARLCNLGGSEPSDAPSRLSLNLDFDLSSNLNLCYSVKARLARPCLWTGEFAIQPPETVADTEQRLHPATSYVLYIHVSSRLWSNSDPPAPKKPFPFLPQNTKRSRAQEGRAQTLQVRGQALQRTIGIRPQEGLSLASRGSPHLGAHPGEHRASSHSGKPSSVKSAKTAPIEVHSRFPLRSH